MKEGEPITAEHALIVGDSGTGKSSLARYVHAETECTSVVADYAGIGGYAGRHYSSIDGLVKSVKSGDKAVVSIEDPVVCTSVAVAYAKRVPWPVQVVVEEAASASTAGDPDDMAGTNPVWWACKRGRNEGVKAVLVEQDPMDIPSTPLKSVPYIAWVGEPAGFHGGFFGHKIGNWIPEDRLPESNYQYVVLHKSGRVVYPKEGTAETPRY